MRVPKLGDMISTWFSGMDNGKSVVLKVEPYKGRFTEFFSHVVRVSAPRVRKGWMEIVI